MTFNFQDPRVQAALAAGTALIPVLAPGAGVSKGVALVNAFSQLASDLQSGLADGSYTIDELDALIFTTEANIAGLHADLARQQGEG